MRDKKKVYLPMRFVNAVFNFTPIQLDLIMLVRYQIGSKKQIQNSFSIDLKPYFKVKGIDLQSARHSHYDKICQSLLASKVSFKYLKGDTLFSHHNLFSYCLVNEDFIFSVEILDDALPLFYLNKLEEGHFKDNRLIKHLFEQSQSSKDIELYVWYLPETYVQFEESSIKILFERLLKYRSLGEYIYSWGKDELYEFLGYGYYKDKVKIGQQNIFNFTEQEFIQTRYKGNNGWKNLKRALNRWLEIMSTHKESGITIDKTGENYLTTRGKPIRDIFISVKYDSELFNLTIEQKIACDFLKEFQLSEKQILRIISDFDPKKIKKMVLDSIIKVDGDWCEYAKHHHPKINNISGFLYGVVFGYGNGFKKF